MPKLDNAIIMAAGLGTRMRPLTNEIPKPLVKVKGKRMIETIIHALHESRIDDITVVTGYLAEKFAFLSEKYPGLKLVNNPYYQQYNNLSSLYVARHGLKNTVILDGDQLINTPQILSADFKKSGYAGSWVNQWTDEWIMHCDQSGHVLSCDRDGGKDGYRLYSVSKWTAKDSAKLGQLVEREFEAKNYDIYWDDVPMFKYSDQFNLVVHQINVKDIVEIDSLDELKQIDPGYEKVGK
ncbi:MULTISPECIES: sugar phosphate nucleotidyltransferase [Lactobacillus]|uniref:Phosphocholine cytidylyltransferase family protein n=1 Tax=Lactobacillus xujianguonis TaxID=2495899 RepID=A0A437SVJ5_9LACO|nr:MULTISPECIES: sugar phosphate nucleotidyltransferase [Lactobacillus]RVU70945.1 phosphocholine cytidylyltransferase family protein [Lactobacillus xujianguonis]RVU73577.1 phosphocholine cytidylyltransferase family protein [Lactobacillus xujianguonis]